MALSTRASRPLIDAPERVTHQPLRKRRTSGRHFFFQYLLMWLCLLAATTGASWYASQAYLQPVWPQSLPAWQGAQWIHATDQQASVAYFRTVVKLDTLPDGAFVTVAADQVFTLYVNGAWFGSNAGDLEQGVAPRAFMYDINRALHTGQNVLLVRAANLNNQTPGIRASLGLVRDQHLSYLGSGHMWQSTTSSQLASPWMQGLLPQSSMQDLQLLDWQAAWQTSAVALQPELDVDPRLYQQPFSINWLSAGNTHDAYFVSHVSIPPGLNSIWLRLAAIGRASVYINGRLITIWDGQVSAGPMVPDSYLPGSGAITPPVAGQAIGVYAIAALLHPGENTLALHVIAPGSSAQQFGARTSQAALSLDLFASAATAQSVQIDQPRDWRASTTASDQWNESGGVSRAWRSALSIGKVGNFRTFYLPDQATVVNQPAPPFSLVLLVVLLSAGGVVVSWLLLSLVVLRRYYPSSLDALETNSLAYLPALAFELLLIVLARDQQLSRFFSLNSFWGAVLLALVFGGYLLLWSNGRMRLTRQDTEVFTRVQPGHRVFQGIEPLRKGLLWLLSAPTAAEIAEQTRILAVRKSPASLLRDNWSIALLGLLAAPLIVYKLGYEPYSADELLPLFAARGILAHGLPVLPSGVIFGRDVAYSYLLAGWIAPGGDPRLLSVLEYLLSIPLIYLVGCYFFDRSIAWLGAAMLAFSPLALLWSRQIGMYEQAQLLTLLTVFLWYRALYERRTWLIYLAMGCLVLDYLSYEETSIILPALLLCTLVVLLSLQKVRPGVILRQKHWWLAVGLGGGFIFLHLLLVRNIHPPMLGTDQSQRPLLQLAGDALPFYLKLLFYPHALGNQGFPWLTANSVLVLLGCIRAIRSSNQRTKYCALFLSVSLLTLCLAFTVASERYFYPLLPLYYLLGSYALLVALRIVRAFALTHLSSSLGKHGGFPASAAYLSRLLRFCLLLTVGLGYLSVLLLPLQPLANSSLLLSQVGQMTSHRRVVDYDIAGRFILQHRQQGDLVIALGSPLALSYYSGPLDYCLVLDQAQSLIEQHLTIVDESTGTTALLNAEDLHSVLASSRRVWLISTNGPFSPALTGTGQFQGFAGLRLVYEGYGTAVYEHGK